MYGKRITQKNSKKKKNPKTNKPIKRNEKRKTKTLGKHFTLFSFGIHKIVSNSKGSANVHV